MEKVRELRKARQIEAEASQSELVPLDDQLSVLKAPVVVAEVRNPPSTPS